ncbi:phage terminase large subunit [soil metagenome]
MKIENSSTTQPVPTTAAPTQAATPIPRDEEILGIPAWRLSNIYSIKTEDRGQPILFNPRPEQKLIINHLIETPDEPLYIIKARRLGMSTAIGLTIADAAAWEGGLQCSLIDQTQADAQRKMAEIMRFALQTLEPLVQERLRFPKLNDTELQVINTFLENPAPKQKSPVGEQISPSGAPESAAGTEGTQESSAEVGSRIYAGRNARGGTNNFLWISEWGPIAATDPKRSQEIRTGALPSARRGRRVVETTWYGGKVGDLWDIIKPVLERDPNAPGQLHFFPWHGDPACVKLTGTIDRDLELYFKDLAHRVGKTFSQDQKRWYASAKLEQGIFIKREYPSTLEEAMSAPIEGTIYGDLLARLHAEGAITQHKVDDSALVHTFWDLGSPQNTVTWYIQLVDDTIRVIDVDLHTKDRPMDFTTTQRVAHILSKGYPLGHHFLPHDAAAQQKGGKTYLAELAEAGLPNLKITPRTNDIWIGINRLRQILPRFTFRLPHCEKALEALQNYHTNTTSTNPLDSPVHDWSCHAADALRLFAEAHMYSMVHPRPRRHVPEEVRRAFDRPRGHYLATF